MKQRGAMKEHVLKRLKYDPQIGRQDLLDPPMPGQGTFGVRVNKTCISFILFYSFHGDSRRLTLGKYPELSLAEARAKAAQAGELLKQGVDPGKKKLVELVEYRTSPTFEAAVESYLEWAKLNKKSWREDERMLRNEFVPHFGRAKVGDIRRKEVMALLDHKAQSARVQSNRMLAVIRKMFNFCVEREILAATPLVQMKMVAKETPRERSLNRHELVWFLHQLAGASLTTNTRFSLLLSLMLAQRSGRVVAMRWVDFDLDDLIWDRSGLFEKNNNPIAIPLSEDVLSILKYLRERQVQKVMSNDPERWADSKKLPSPGQHVFPGRWPTKPQTQPSLNRAMRRFYDDYVKDQERLEEESLLRVADGYPRPTVHDLRRTATTHMSKHGLGKDVRSRILNHKDLSVDAIYDRYSYFEEKAVALQGWHAYLKGLLRKEFGDVDWVEFYGRRMEV
ncbi:integrase arm-type DNA-binding domain-containing protein [Pseudomonas aeruginosa]|jgi:integrase|uniref:integrase arm-type DNA-binding domain-containing protein n=1 Tax=Pseudomonas aeruginosa TaxID=287 RepID=UPI00296657D3|nr:integrase arm-type DNA-binding domain-containing protein [Pseudomonas aeruginosa]MDW2963201.1 tyrosine-type recombinase/integrase [Pseudomonas aeruginosa]HEP8117531.1 integrase family protein [Pseudomonas aeruginosa]